jgi:hypothetical protein
VNLLRSCVDRFRSGDQDPRVDLRAILAGNFSKLSGLLSDTKLEIHYGYMSSKDYAGITKSVKQLIQHLGSMDSVIFPVGSQELRGQVRGKEISEKFLMLDSVEILGNACISDMNHIRKYLKEHLNLQSEILPDMIESLKEFDVKQDEV